jgi:hypothetical protein
MNPMAKLPERRLILRRMEEARSRQSPAPSSYLYHCDIEYAKHAKIRSMRILISRINLVVKAWGCFYDFVLPSSTSRQWRTMLGPEKLHDNSHPRQPEPTHLTQSLEHAREHASPGQSAAVIRKVPRLKLCFPFAVGSQESTCSRSCMIQGLK